MILAASIVVSSTSDGESFKIYLTVTRAYWPYCLSGVWWGTYPGYGGVNIRVDIEYQNTLVWLLYPGVIA